MKNPPKHGPIEWVLITGASHGIGRALALECLDNGLAVAIVALDNKNLIEMERECAARPGCITAFLGLDLTSTDAMNQIEDWLDREKIQLKYLINNAGFGRGGLFEHTDLRTYRTMMRLNNQVMMELVYRLLPQLIASRGGILNMSSMEATLPLPYKTVYTGTKSFVYSFSLALREEMAYHDVGVSVLCPGPVITNEDGMKRVRAQGWRAKLLVKLPEDIAPEAISGMLANKDVIRPGLLVKILVTVGYLVPRKWRMAGLEKIFSRYREEVPEAVLEEVAV